MHYFGARCETKLRTMESLKATLVFALGLSRDALHTYMGLGIFLVSAFALRKSLSSPIPLLLVFCAAAGNETYDLVKDISSQGRWRWGTSVFDFVSIVFWPTTIMLMARFGFILKKQ